MERRGAAAVCFWLLFVGACGEHISGALTVTPGLAPDASKWRFLSRFAFVNDGTFNFSIRFSAVGMCCQASLLAYFDSTDQWSSVYPGNPQDGTDATCQQKVQKASRTLLMPELNSECTYLPPPNTDQVVQCEGTRIVKGARPRWWYFAVANCESKGINMTYEMHFNNGETIFTRHFSADELGVLETDIAFFVLFFILAFLSIWLVRELLVKRMLHRIVLLLLGCVLVSWLGVVLKLVHYASLSVNGVGSAAMQLLGSLLLSAGDLSFLLLLILVAKGLAVTRGRISYKGQLKIGIFFGTYGLVYAGVFIWQAVAFDKAEVLYLYESPPGYALIVMRFVSYAWFTYANYTTLRNFPKYKAFYIRFFVAFSLWFLSLPVMVLLAFAAMADWNREVMVNAASLFVLWFAMLVLVYLWRPTKRNVNFPFRVRSNQVGIQYTMEESPAVLLSSQTGAGDNSVSNYMLAGMASRAWYNSRPAIIPGGGDEAPLGGAAPMSATAASSSTSNVHAHDSNAFPGRGDGADDFPPEFVDPHDAYLAHAAMSRQLTAAAAAAVPMPRSTSAAKVAEVQSTQAASARSPSSQDEHAIDVHDSEQQQQQHDDEQRASTTNALSKQYEWQADEENRDGSSRDSPDSHDDHTTYPTSEAADVPLLDKSAQQHAAADADNAKHRLAPLGRSRGKALAQSHHAEERDGDSPLGVDDFGRPDMDTGRQPKSAKRKGTLPPI